MSSSVRRSAFRPESGCVAIGNPDHRWVLIGWVSSPVLSFSREIFDFCIIFQFYTSLAMKQDVFKPKYKGLGPFERWLALCFQREDYRRIHSSICTHCSISRIPLHPDSLYIDSESPCSWHIPRSQRRLSIITSSLRSKIMLVFWN